MWSTRTSATRRRSSVRSGWTIPPEDGAARDTQRVVQALSSSPSGPAGSVGREAPQDGPQPFNLAPEFGDAGQRRPRRWSRSIASSRRGPMAG